MDEDTSLFDKTKRQTINPLVDEINKSVEPLLKIAMEELGYELPLTVRLYNQIRFYEEYGKLKLGVNVASVDTLAEQFGVTKDQIRMAYNNLTNKYKLGKWVGYDKPIFRNVRRTWMSNVRLENGVNYYTVIPELLHGNSKTITREYFPTEVAPLSESKGKVSESNNNTDVLLRGAPAPRGNPEINQMFDYWEKATGYSIQSRIKPNRNACSNLIKKHGIDRLMRLIDGVALSHKDQFAPSISDFEVLQKKTNDLIVWGRKKQENGTARF